jgi:cyclomaltodextrinase / maltogenic alpha-amylase / neopullulanase
MNIAKKVLSKEVLCALAGAASLAASAGSAFLMEARPSSDWFTRGVVYQVQPRAFSSEGTLKAIEAKLPYLKDLGVTIVYLVPVMEMDDDRDKSFWSPRQIRSGFDNPKNQYRLKDYFHVDPEYGTDADLKALVATAHRLGLKVIFDLVYFHAGPGAKVWKEHPEFTAWNADGTIAKGQWRFPRFNFRVPGVKEYLWNNMTGLIRDYDVDGYRCDVGDGVPLDFWCEGVRRMKAVKADAILLCEGSNEQDQVTAFDADYGWFPGGGVVAGKDSAQVIRRSWEGREKRNVQGARFVNHYENHDIATDSRPRREQAWGAAAIDQVLVWMFTIDGVPMLFTGNEMADADPRHSMFGKTPMDWAQLGREPGKSRHALVKELAALRAGHAAFTDLNGRDGLSWLDVTATNSVTAFVRRAKDGKQIVVVQNWKNAAVTTDVSFAVAPEPVPSYLAAERVDRSVKGVLAAKPLLSRGAEKTGDRSFRLAPYGFAVYEVEKAKQMNGER